MPFCYEFIANTGIGRVFIAKVINFFGIGIALYGLAGAYQFFSKDPIIKHTIKCKYCRKRVNERVSPMVHLDMHANRAISLAIHVNLFVASLFDA